MLFLSEHMDLLLWMLILVVDDGFKLRKLDGQELSSRVQCHRDSCARECAFTLTGTLLLRTGPAV